MKDKETVDALIEIRQVLYDYLERRDKRKIGKALRDISGLLGALTCPNTAPEDPPLAEWEDEMEQTVDNPSAYFLHVEECFELAKAEGRTLNVTVTIRKARA